MVGKHGYGVVANNIFRDTILRREHIGNVISTLKLIPVPPTCDIILQKGLLILPIQCHQLTGDQVFNYINLQMPISFKSLWIVL